MDSSSAGGGGGALDFVRVASRGSFVGVLGESACVADSADELGDSVAAEEFGGGRTCVVVITGVAVVVRYDGTVRVTVVFADPSAVGSSCDSIGNMTMAPVPTAVVAPTTATEAIVLSRSRPSVAAALLTMRATSARPPVITRRCGRQERVRCCGTLAESSDGAGSPSCAERMISAARVDAATLRLITT